MVELVRVNRLLKRQEQVGVGVGVDNLLLEDNCNLLLEDGCVIVLE